jgi:hypothetical protein
MISSFVLVRHSQSMSPSTLISVVHDPSDLAAVASRFPFRAPLSVPRVPHGFDRDQAVSPIRIAVPNRPAQPSRDRGTGSTYHQRRRHSQARPGARGQRSAACCQHRSLPRTYCGARDPQRAARPSGALPFALKRTFTPLGFLCARGLPVASKGSRMDRYSAIINLLVVAVLLVILIASRLWRDE